MGEDKLKAVLQEPLDLIFARVAPEHKMQVVAALKDLGAIVAVTGDGVNDAPALKRADIGVAMGLTGTDVSREAATMILLDDSFASIIKAVEQGRGVYANIKKMVTYIFSHNMAEFFPYVFAAFAGVHLVPLGALQMLSIDLGSDVLPGLSLGVEQPEPGVMKRPPTAKKSERAHEQAHHRPHRLHRGHPVGHVGRRIPVCAAQPRLALGRRQLGASRQPALHVLRRGGDDDPGRDRRQSVLQRLRLPHRARVGLQGRHLQEQGAGVLGDLRRGIMAAISYLPPLQHLFKTGPLSAARLGDPVGRRARFVLRRRGEKMVVRRRPVAGRLRARPGKEA